MPQTPRCGYGVLTAVSHYLYFAGRWSDHVHLVGAFARQAPYGATPIIDPIWSPDGSAIAFSSPHDGDGWQVSAQGLHQRRGDCRGIA